MNWKEKLIVPSYWLLFIFIPLIVIGSTVIHFQYPKWILILIGIVLLWGGEHGIRKWAALIKKAAKPKSKE
jgi:hypothetical protein